MLCSIYFPLLDLIIIGLVAVIIAVAAVTVVLLVAKPHKHSAALNSASIG